MFAKPVLRSEKALDDAVAAEVANAVALERERARADMDALAARFRDLEASASLASPLSPAEPRARRAQSFRRASSLLVSPLSLPPAADVSSGSMLAPDQSLLRYTAHKAIMLHA
jgi:hypothetical protein